MLVKFSVVTLFPEALTPYLRSSMLRKASEQGIVEFELVNLRDFGIGPHRSVDDTLYGGGDGMLLRCEPAFAAIESIKKVAPTAEVIIPTPAGELWTQRFAECFASAILARALDRVPAPTGAKLDKNTNLFSNSTPTTRTKSVHSTLDKTATYDERTRNIAIDKTRKAGSTQTQITIDKATEYIQGNEKATLEKSAENGQNGDGNSQNKNGTDIKKTTPAHYIIFCPHYEGLDARILTLADHQISLGKYILTGGELPALIIIDSIVRLLPGVLGGENSARFESFADGDNLECPQYTKPADFRGMKVPEVLLSGDHAAIARWRAENAGVFGDGKN